jgi:16S rRNA (guanine527-N7)-methyltransferase
MFHVKHEGWAAAERLGVSLNDSQVDALEQFEDLLRDRAAPMGMVASADIPRLRERHVLDSVRATPLIPPDATSVADLGSGAGLPGIPVAIARPELDVTLVEVRRNRAAFLEETTLALGLPRVRVHARRLETFRQEVDVCLARAVGNARDTWQHAERILSPEGVLIYWAGRSFDPAHDLPAGVTVRVSTTPALERSGSLVIMGRQ